MRSKGLRRIKNYGKGLYHVKREIGIKGRDAGKRSFSQPYDG
jgi:hypothetical protein